MVYPRLKVEGEEVVQFCIFKSHQAERFQLNTFTNSKQALSRDYLSASDFQCQFLSFHLSLVLFKINRFTNVFY